jgi:FkbM family methyltransferase
MPAAASPDAPPAPDPELHEAVRTAIGTLWVARSDGTMRPYLRRRGAWEEEEGALLRTLLRPGHRFLDVGANIGYFTILAHRAAPQISVDAVEPHPETVKLLRWNAWLNGVRVSVWPCALDDRAGRVAMAAPEANPGDCRVGATGPDAFTVTAVTADEVFAGRGFDVVKIDVQGWEREVIRGMRRVLRSSPDVRLVVEFWPQALRERGVEPYDVLEEYRATGFDVVTQVADRLRRLDDDGIMAVCDEAGVLGQVNLLLH